MLIQEVVAGVWFCGFGAILCGIMKCQLIVIYKSVGGSVDPAIAKREKARLYEMQRLKKQKIREMLDVQNAAIDAEMNNKGKGRLNYLLQQTEIFAHFAMGINRLKRSPKEEGVEMHQK